MHVYEIPSMRFSLPAGGEIGLHRFVSVADGKAIRATASTNVIGVSMNDAMPEEVGEGYDVVEIADGIVIVTAGAQIASGVAIASDANGQAIPATDKAIGVAITATTGAGQLVTVKI